MLSRWRSKCFLNRPAKQIHSLIYGGWFYIESARPFLKRHCYAIMCEHHYATHVGMHKWSRESLFNRPTRCKSKTQSPLGYPYPFCPVFQTHGFIIKCKQSSLSSIVLLLFSSAPLAIIWFVVAVVVNPVKRVFATWLWPHVRQEVKKRLSPFCAYSYASSAVPMVSTGVRIVAACFHHFPRIVFNGCLACGMSSSFRFRDRGNRILFSHLKLLQSFMVDRTARRRQSPGCSHYATHGMLVQ